jgi:hypothetical protein
VNVPAYDDTSVGLRSLALKFDAPIEEVRELAAKDALAKFFKRTAEEAKPVSAALRLAQAKAIDI